MIFTVTGAQTNNRVFIYFIIYNNEEEASLQEGIRTQEKNARTEFFIERSIVLW